VLSSKNRQIRGLCIQLLGFPQGNLCIPLPPHVEKDPRTLRLFLLNITRP